MPNIESKSETEPEPKPTATSKTLTSSQKRARPASITTNSDSNFLKQGFTIVKRHKNRASQLGQTIQGTQNIRNTLALATQPSSHK